MMFVEYNIINISELMTNQYEDNYIVPPSIILTTYQNTLNNSNRVDMISIYINNIQSNQFRSTLLSFFFVLYFHSWFYNRLRY